MYIYNIWFIKGKRKNKSLTNSYKKVFEISLFVYCNNDGINLMLLLLWRLMVH